MNLDKWTPDISVSEVIQEGDLKIIFDEIKEKVAETAQSKEIYYQRSSNVFGIAVAVLTGILAYLGSLGINFHVNVLTANLIVIALILIYILFKLKNNLKPVNFNAKGTQAKNLYTQKYFINQNKRPEWLMLYNLIKDHQSRFDENTEINKDILGRLDEAINWLFFIPGLSILIWIVGIILQLDFFK